MPRPACSWGTSTVTARVWRAAWAAEWYRRAARLGQPEAQYELALMYELGIGVARDPADAAMWYGLSSAQACPSELAAGGGGWGDC